VSNVIGYLQSVIELYTGCSILVTSDFNFECQKGNVGYDIFSEFMEEHGLLCCDDLELSATGYIYHHDALGRTSWLDHMFVDYFVNIFSVNWLAIFNRDSSLL